MRDDFEVRCGGGRLHAPARADTVSRGTLSAGCAQVGWRTRRKAAGPRDPQSLATELTPFPLNDYRRPFCYGASRRAWAAAGVRAPAGSHTGSGGRRRWAGALEAHARMTLPACALAGSMCACAAIRRHGQMSASAPRAPAPSDPSRPRPRTPLPAAPPGEAAAPPAEPSTAAPASVTHVRAPTMRPTSTVSAAAASSPWNWEVGASATYVEPGQKFKLTIWVSHKPHNAPRRARSARRARGEQGRAGARPRRPAGARQVAVALAPTIATQRGRWRWRAPPPSGEPVATLFVVPTAAH